MTKYLSGELIVHKLKTYRDITDEYVSEIDLELPMIEPVDFNLMGNTYVVQKVVIRSKWLEDGLELSYVINGYTPELPVSDNVALEAIEILRQNYGKDKPLKDYNFEDEYESWLSEQAWEQWGADNY
jgi:hypothetical protein